MKTRGIVWLVVLAVVGAWTAGASAEIVAQLPGDTVFDGTSGVSLGNVSIGEEGRVDLEFKADVIDGYLWSLSDGSTLNSYRLWLGTELGTTKLFAAIRSDDAAYAIFCAREFTDTTDFHSLTMSWKKGDSIVVTLDGAILDDTGDSSLLRSFTASAHLAGDHAVANGSCFDGTIRNLTVRNTSAVPEPSTMAIAASGLLSLLAYAWRRRK